MKKLLLILLLAASAGIIKAYDFKVGDLYYNDLYYQNTVEVTHESYGEDNYVGLTNVDIPNTVTYQGTIYSVTGIGFEAFSRCSSLTSIRIPNSVTTIRGEAFYDCISLTEVTIPNSVTSIGHDAFRKCESLRYVTISNSVKTIERWTFYDCKNLIEVTIPNSVTSIEDDAFRNCISLTEVTIPNSVISIGNNVFDACYSLTSVSIPNSVTSIGRFAFQSCGHLNYITCEADTPPSLGAKVFDHVDKSIPLYVPANSITLYKGAIQWKDFTDIQAITDEDNALDDITIDSDFVKYYENGNVYILRDGKTYTIQGQEVK